MAWRESRTQRGRLVLFLSCISLGVAALVAINSFGYTLRSAIDDQAKELLGSDLMFESRMEFSDEILALADSIGGHRTKEIQFNSMVRSAKDGETRLARIRAIEPDFPFYGELETVPRERNRIETGRSHALVDQTLFYQLNLERGDTLIIGNQSYVIDAEVTGIPGESAVAGLTGPRVFIPLNDIASSGLLDRGSQVFRYIHFRFDDGRDAEALKTEIEATLEANRVRAETPESRKEDFGEAFLNLTRFLNLVGFIALLLGGIGVASAVHTYIRQRLGGIAVLRCLGASSRQTFAIYLVQVIMMGLAGALVGSVIGAGLQYYLPVLMDDFIPVDLEPGLAFLPVLQGIIIGTVAASLFALLPLVAIRDVSPLLTLRSAEQSGQTGSARGLRTIIASILALLIIAFSIQQTGRVDYGLGFAGGVFAAFGLLYLTALGLIKLAKKLIRPGMPYLLRQGISNLYRPNNQTVILLLAVGFGTFLIGTLYMTRDVLIDQVRLTQQESRANLVFYDIQTNQLEPAKTKLKDRGMPIVQEVPIVTMRMREINGEPLESIRDSGDRTVPDWIYARELRVTHRDSLTRGEEIVKGNFQSTFDGEGVIPISMAKGMAEQMDLDLGDRINFELQGVVFETEITSLREVEWQQVQPNFIFVFPSGVLEDAPQFHVLVTNAESRQVSAEIQSQMIAELPNVSALDLELILETVDEILGKVGYVIQFMALFSVFTGLVVLFGAIMTSRYQRLKETVLLKTLGASSRQVTAILAVEYAVLGLLSALTGLILATAATWVLALVVFEVPFITTWQPILVTLVAVVLLTLLIGSLNSRGVYRKPSLETLRAETV